MNKRSQQRKLTAWLILLTFLFTSIMPTNIGSWNSTAEAATYDTATNTITLTVGESFHQPRVTVRTMVLALLKEEILPGIVTTAISLLLAVQD